MRCVECHEETSQLPCWSCGREPRVKGRYQLLAKVGGGASGAVYRALDGETGDMVAVKEVMLGGLDSEKARELAVREARVLRQLDHPGIAGWRDECVMGIGRSAALYLVQELAEGENLQDGLLSHRWSEREVLELLAEVLEVLEYLHTRHPPVIHRDVKPANLVRLADGGLKLVDFGSVRDALRNDALGSQTIAGTFGYMAPEQFAGQALPATDIYGLGMTAVSLLSRKNPAELHDRSGVLHWEVEVSVSTRVRALLQSMLHPDPHRRRSQAGELRREVERILHPPAVEVGSSPVSPSLRDGGLNRPPPPPVRPVVLQSLPEVILENPLPSGSLGSPPQLQPTELVASKRAAQEPANVGVQVLAGLFVLKFLFAIVPFAFFVFFVLFLATMAAP